jgi:hypothetical protein
VNANQADAKRIGMHAFCRVLGVSSSGYYDWLQRAPSARKMANVMLTERIRQVHKDSDETYDMPRVRAELQEAGQKVSRKRVARLMREARIYGVSRRRGFTVTTERNPRQRPAPDLVIRQFRAEAPDQLWVADMTYIPTWTGFLYLAIVLDAFSRKVVGWAMGERMTADLVIAALNMALHTRRPDAVIIIRIKAASTPAWPSAAAAAKWACGLRWEPWAMPTTTRWPRASSPPLNASFLIDAAVAARPRRERLCSPGSRVGTTRADATRRSTTCRRSTLKGNTSSTKSTSKNAG